MNTKEVPQQPKNMNSSRSKEYVNVIKTYYSWIRTVLTGRNNKHTIKANIVKVLKETSESKNCKLWDLIIEVYNNMHSLMFLYKACRSLYRIETRSSTI